MKAAVCSYHFGDIPHDEDFPDSTPLEEEILAQVNAVALEEL